MALRWLQPNSRISSGTSSRRREGPRLFLNNVLQHRLVQAQVGHDLLELAILLFKLAQASKVRRPHAGVLLTPLVERGIADAHLAADLLDADAQLRLLQRVGHLLLGELALPHGMNSWPLLEPLHAGPFCY